MPAGAGRNPRTGTAVDVAEKYVPFFKTGKELRQKLNLAAKAQAVAAAQAAAAQAAAKSSGEA